MKFSHPVLGAKQHIGVRRDLAIGIVVDSFK
jgi:hypothetical protein